MSWSISAAESCGGSVACSTLIALTSAPPLGFLPIPTSDELDGLRTVNPATTTSFLLESQLCDERGCGADSDGAVVTVALGGGSAPSFVFKGFCAGATEAYTPIDLRNELSACLEVVRICASESNEGEIRIDQEGGDHAKLVPGECTRSFFTGPGTLLTASISRLFEPAPSGGYCGGLRSGGDPPDIGITVEVSCNASLEGCGLGSATEALLSEPDDGSDADEPVTFCNLELTCGDGTCAEFCEDSANCSADCAVSLVPQALCGDGILEAGEACEVDSHCATGYFCGDAASNAPCGCLPLSSPDNPATGEWGACGSCDSCGFAAAECVLDPNGACVWDPQTCGSQTAVCGNGKCESGENPNNCDSDCK